MSTTVIIILIVITFVNIGSILLKVYLDFRASQKKKAEILVSLQESEARVAQLLKKMDENRFAFYESIKRVQNIPRE